MTARSLLFVPGDKPHMLTKAPGRGAHGLIVDLEDAVAPIGKDEARDAVADWLSATPRLDAECWVRVNTGPTGADDLALLGPLLRDGVMIPKVETVAHVAHVADVVAAVAPTAGIIVLIETAGALVDIVEIARIDGVRRLMLGTFDLGADLGIAEDAPAWAAIGLAMVTASAAAHIEAPLAGVDRDFSDPNRIEDETRRLAASGFGGRPAIHPAQIAAINRAFAPTVEEARAAAEVLAHHATLLAEGVGAYTDEAGRMMDDATVRRARAVVAEARRAGIEVID